MCNSRSTHTDETLDRFWSKVMLGPECWLWRASPKERYGRFRLDARYIGAHQASWILARGPIPEGLHVLHKCDNPRCVRPEHLFLGTNQDNVNDRHVKGRDARGDQHGSRLHPTVRPRGEAQWLAKLDESKVREIRRRAEAGEALAALAIEFKVTTENVRLVVRRRSWAHVSQHEETTHE
jgi:hypothetical protein